MATYATQPAWEVRARALSSAPVAVPLGLGALVAITLLLRSGALGVGFWIDEGLSVGIADRPLEDIPGVLRQDGSPPLYYMLLNRWMAVFGDGEAATHRLSLLFAALAVPVAFWAGLVLFGRRAGWIAAVLYALNPFLTRYAQETRMYALVILLGLVTCATFARAFAVREPGERVHPGWLAGFAVSLAASFYTHNWALFLGVALGVVWLGLLAAAPRHGRRALLRDGLIGFGGAALLFAPWVPSLLYQAAHTGAPWAKAPGLDQLLGVPARLLGEAGHVAFLLAAGAGLAALVAGRARSRTAAGGALALLAAVVLCVLVAWLTSQVSPAWANRYLAVALAPLLLVGAAGLANAGGLGLAGVALIALLWIPDGPPAGKSNVRDVAAVLSPSLQPGDLVVSTQPEQAPVLAYYLPEGVRFGTLTGPVNDLGVTDWRDGVQRLQASVAASELDSMLDSLPVGRRLVLVRPIVDDFERWSARWTELVRRRSEEWAQYVSNDRRFRISLVYPQPPYPRRPLAVSATVLVKETAG
jgi:mannosyltransferase